MEFDVYGAASKSAILLVNGQADDSVLQRKLRTASFTTSLAQSLAAATDRTVVVPDIVDEKEHDPAEDLRDVIARFEQIAILTRSAGYAYGLRAASHPNVSAVAIWYGNLADPNLALPSVPTLVVTCEHDFWSSNEAAQKFVADSGAQRIHLPNGHHAFDVVDDTEESRDAINRTAMFLRDHLPVPDRD
ncbi:MAG TPA: hypothetical protein VLU46_13660 [Thermoanaerobaculia bacterium]|nr:hypothetical protein [Thermoanaerobaculia bacterium]